MEKRKIRAGIAAVLAGVVLFSPLVCGMSCLEARVSRARAGAEDRRREMVEPGRGSEEKRGMGRGGR